MVNENDSRVHFVVPDLRSGTASERPFEDTVLARFDT